METSFPRQTLGLGGEYSLPDPHHDLVSNAVQHPGTSVIECGMLKNGISDDGDALDTKY